MRQSDLTAIATDISGPVGRYHIDAPPGAYRLIAEAPGFAHFQSDMIEIAPPGRRVPAAAAGIRVDIVLHIAGVVEQVEVPDAVVEGARSGRDIVLDARDVQQMPVDSVALLNELTGLAGSASAQILVDGFSGARLPSRESIREIRINQNPYSAENDTDTVNAVIRVLTQPGTARLHGDIYLYGDDSALNARNPFAPTQPHYYADGAGAEISGSLDNRTTAYARVDQLEQNTNAAVNAVVLNSALAIASAQYTVANPRATLNTAARADVKLRGDSTLMLRYSLDRLKQTNIGVGELSLATQGADQSTFVHTFQAGNTWVIGPRLVQEARAQYIRTRTTETPVSTAPAILVQGAFTGGGNTQGLFRDHQDRLELQEHVSFALQQHFLYMGGRARINREASLSQSQFNGQFIFASLSSYEATLAGAAAGHTPAQIAAAGGGASEYIVSAGDPNAAATVVDSAAFLQDNWKLRPNLKLSYGLRFESQNRISDHTDWAPRVGFSWGLGAPGAQTGSAAPRYILHGGGGIFYQRLDAASVIRVTRFDGTRLQQYVIDSPQFCPPATSAIPGFQSCPGVPSLSALQSQGAATIYRINPRYHAPYFMEASAGLDRQLGRRGVAGISYLVSRGVHTPYLENANAPLPGTYSLGNSGGGVRPLGKSLNAYEYESEGVFHTRQLTSNVALRSARWTLTGNYILQFSRSDAENNGTFPLDRFNMATDYGRSSMDIRHAATLTGSLMLPYGFSSWMYLRAASGAPYNIVVGDDLNGDTQYNDRPAFATDLTRASVVRTPLGAFDTRPTASETLVPRNSAEGPGMLTLNLAAGKTMGFGPRAKDASTNKEPRFTAELWIQALNLLNHPNLTTPVAVVDSPLFGHSVGVTSGGSLSPSRAFDLQLSLRF